MCCVFGKKYVFFVECIDYVCVEVIDGFVFDDDVVDVVLGFE